MNDRYACWQKVWPQGVPRHVEVSKPFTEYFREQADDTPDAVAIEYYGRQIPYKELNCYIDQFANALISQGLRKGDRVAIYMQNSPQFVISFFGTVRAGGIVVCLNPMFRSTELASILQMTGFETIVVQTSLLNELYRMPDISPPRTIIATRLADFVPDSPTLSLPSEIMASAEFRAGTVDFQSLMAQGECTPVCRVENMDNDLALLQLTGGTTGTPKAAMISIKAFTVAVLVSRNWFGLTSQDTNLGVAPFFHIMGLQITMAPTLVSGGRLLILTRFTPEVTARAIAEGKCTTWVGAPTMLTALVNMPGVESYDFSSLRVIVTGGAPISITLQQKIKAIAPNSQLGEGYGMTEVLAQGGVTTPLGRWKPGFAGIPPISDIKIMDLVTGEKEMPPNAAGEIVIKGPTMMTGYWNDVGETQKSIRNGWFYSGDIGFLDEEGYLKIIDRKKELILCGGLNVYPSDVENMLSRHPAIQEVAVVGVTDEYRGQSPKAFVILKSKFKDKVTENEIIDWCRENMAAYKRPRQVAFRESFPKSGAGKILKRMLI